MKKILRMNRAILLYTVFILLIPAALLAEDKSIEYTIQKGDTLWTISSGKLKDPFLWPKLWEANPKVHNPHLIFPDQVILIPGELLKDSLRGEMESTPGVRLNTKKRLVPSKIISSRYLPSGPRKPIVSREVLLDSGYFSRSFVPEGKIISRDPEKTVFGNGDIVYVSASGKLIPDTKFYIGEKAKAIRNPVGENEIVGYLVRIKGILQIAGEENSSTKGIITENYKEINAGDVILNYYPVSLSYEPVIERKPQLTGVVIGVGHKRNPGGKDDVVYINKGSRQGVEIGDIFTVSSGKPPHPVIGTLQVFSVFDEASVAIIKKSTYEVNPGDTFGN
jgi:LysM repeat protein